MASIKGYEVKISQWIEQIIALLHLNPLAKFAPKIAGLWFLNDHSNHWDKDDSCPQNLPDLL